MDFAMHPPVIITGDNYEQGEGVRKGRLWEDDSVHINIFNISKINSEVRGDKAPKIKRLSEYIGESYFDYLSKLEDLVLLMDESHRYRASAGIRAINDLKPILGLELTATPQVEKGTKAIEKFKNVIFNYPLSAALKDGFVKVPAVCGRENFDADSYTKEGLEELKLKDGILVHEETKVQLDLYAREYDARKVKPFMLVVAEDTTHASALKTYMESTAFYDGQYKGKVIEVHSQQKGEEKDENVQLLLGVEDPENPTEIVIHVNMLKEGWDVTNLYTIVPLRAANSKTLVEQSIGRGLRLPYGKRTGVPAVDCLNIVSHDKFQAIIDEAKKPDSIIRTGVIIGKDIPLEKSKAIAVEPKIVARLTGTALPYQPQQEALFKEPVDQKIAVATYESIKEFEQLPRSADLKKPEVMTRLIERVKEKMTGGEAKLFEDIEPERVLDVVSKTIDYRNEMSIDIPRIIVTPKGDVEVGFRDFDLVTTGHLQPLDQDILIAHLHDDTRHKLRSGTAVVSENRLEDYLVRGLIEFDDIHYDTHAELLYKLSGQMVKHLQSYLKPEDVLNVLQAHQQIMVNDIHSQMEQHYEEKATEYEVHVSRGFQTLKPYHYSTKENEKARPFRSPVDPKMLIRGMLFTGFQKCLYPELKFHSDTERRFTVLLENDKEVVKWLKPNRGDFQIQYSQDAYYEPDFVVETNDTRYLCEPKASSEMDDETVQLKAKAAVVWCKHATAHGGKPWKYLLVPHDKVDETKTLAGLAGAWEMT